MKVLFRFVAPAAIGCIAQACFMSGAGAQEMPAASWSSEPPLPAFEWRDDMGRTAETGAGELGQRQTARDIAPLAQPGGRVDGRVQSRVQNRLRNRIDRYYDPTANARSPFEVASERTRVTGAYRPSR